MGLSWRMRSECTSVRRALPELAAVGDASAEVLAHLRGCVACRREYAAFRQAARALSGLADASAGEPELTDDAFFDTLETATLSAVAVAPVPGRGRIRLGGRRLLVAAACLASAVLGHWLAGRSSPPGDGLLRRDPLMLPEVRITAPQPTWLLPVGFTPSRQGLRGQQLLCREAALEFAPSGPSTR